MSKVDWSLAPEDATFYANGTFRKLNDSKNVLLWFNHAWNPAPYSQEDLKRHNDYEERPAKIIESEDYVVDWNNAPEWADKVGNVKSIANKNMLAFMNDHQFLFIRGLERGEDPYPFGGAYRAKEEFEIVAERPKSVALEKSGAIKSEWSDKHYNNYYQLSEKDIKEGKVKIDAYFVNKMWKLNEKDDTGALFHCLKTVARFGDKNPIERELNALYNQVKRMAELYGVELK
jgi:hypothetical protein